ncbi:MAG: hypothetical protein WBK76_03655 [Candidatus Saccharimonadales bacterium]|jgi:hypothetical protein
MTDLSKLEEYEINEKDIDSVLNYMRIFDPENATSEKAIEFLEYLRVGLHEKAHGAKDEDLKALYDKYKSEKA